MIDDTHAVNPAGTEIKTFMRIDSDQIFKSRAFFKFLGCESAKGLDACQGGPAFDAFERAGNGRTFGQPMVSY
jgi:hypothetical protein